MRLFVTVLLMFAVPAFAQGSGPTPALANRQLPDPAKEAEATRLMHSLRCIQCQGQSIADSDASMAATIVLTNEIKIILPNIANIFVALL